MKKVLSLSIALIISLVFNFTTLNDLRGYNDSISYFKENYVEVLTTFQLENVHDLKFLIEVSENLKLVLAIEDKNNNYEEYSFLSHAMNYYTSLFSSELSNSINTAQTSVVHLNKDMQNYKAILSWYFKVDDYSKKNMTIDQLINKLDLDNETKEQLLF